MTDPLNHPDPITPSPRHPVTPSPLHLPPARPVLFYIQATLLAALITGTIAPTLTWLEFSNGSEGLNVGTVQEMYRTGEWLVPTLQGQTRLAKPPLTAWITAAGVSRETMAQLDSTDQTIRDAAFTRLAWETRWPTLLAGFITLLLTAELGRLIAGNSVGIAALIVTGTSLIFLRFIRYSSTDVQLMLWVAASNVFIAHALLRGRFWIGFIGAGFTLGIGMLAKGPLVLVQSVIPFALWLAWDRINSRQSKTRGFEPILSQSVEPVATGTGKDLKRISESLWPGIAPMLVGAAVFVLVGMSWFIMVYLSEPRAISIWITEITREGATDSPRDPFYRYLSLFPLVMPWMIFLLMGLIVAVANSRTTMVLPLLLTFVPLLIMSIAKDKAERYVLPMLPAAAILTALGLKLFQAQPWVAAGHWVIMGALGIGFPIAAMLMNPAWVTYPVGGMLAIAGALVLCIGLAAHRKIPPALVYATLVIMLGVQVLFITGYRQTREGKAELKVLTDRIVSQYPAAKVWHTHPRPQRRAPTEVGVYLNRVVENTPNPLSIQQTDRPQAIFLEQDAGNPDPTMPPPWQFLAKAPRNADWWWVYILPPKPAGS